MSIYFNARVKTKGIDLVRFFHRIA